jgi:hypothetical protein
METKSEWKTPDPPNDTAKVEVATITHEGRDFTAMGAVIDHDRGIVIGYPSLGCASVGACGKHGALNSWDGTELGRVEVIARSRGFYGAEIVHFRAYVDGKAYHGKGSGWEALLRLRACKRGR